MKTRRTILAAVGCLAVAGIILSFGGCSALVQRTSAKKVPLSYYSKISVGAPVVEGRRVVVPLALSDAPPINSALSPYRIKTHISGREIEMSVVVALSGKGSLSKHQLELSDVSPGDYTVYYRDPDGTRNKLSQITIPAP